jgi:DNA-binding transcriptional ArsR family regulator
MSMQEAEAVAAIARALGDETRVRLIDELAAGEATVSDLASRLGLDQPRVSTHLGVLREAGLVEVRPEGRQRAYALRGQVPAMALATLRTLTSANGAPTSYRLPGPTVRTLRDTSPLRQARTCYDHLAGVAGVELLDGLLSRSWLDGTDGRDLRLTETGARALAAAGVDLDAARRSRRAFAIRCDDWTERRTHLGGALGASLLVAMLDQRRVRLRAGDRAVDLAPGEPSGFIEAAVLV